MAQSRADYTGVAKIIGTQRGMGPILILFGLLGVSVLIAFSLTKTSGLLILGAITGFMVLATAFMHPEFGVAILIISMLLSPEIGAGSAGGGSSVESSRSVVIRLDDILLAILSAAWFTRTAVHKIGLIRKTPLNKPIGIYILSCIISTMIGFMAGNVKGKIGAFFVVRYIEYFVVFFLAINFINSRKTLLRFMRIAFFTAIVVSVYGLSQIPLGVRVSAPFEGDQGEPNTMGGYLLMMMCMAGGQLLFARGLKHIFAWSGLLVLMAIPMLFTGSRASWVGIPASMAIFFIFSHKKRQLAVIVVVLIASANVILPQSVKERLLFTFTQETQTRARQLQVGGVRLDSSTTARIDSYKTAVDGWRQKPILGWGITGIIFIDSQYVRTLAETGLLGMMSLLWLYWTYFSVGRAAMRASPDGFQRGIAIGYIAALAGLLMHGSGSNTFIILRIMEPWMLFTAMVVQIPLIYEAREKEWEEFEGEQRAIAEKTGEDDEPPKKYPPLSMTSAKEAAQAAYEARREEHGMEHYEIKPTEYEEFLEREKIEMARFEVEAKLDKLESTPDFRRRSHTMGMNAKPFSRTPAREPGNGAAPPEAPKEGEEDGDSPKPLRGVDVARGGGGEGPNRRSMLPPMRRK